MKTYMFRNVLKGLLMLLMIFQLKALDSLPKYEEMTDEMYFYYFPELYPDPEKPRVAPYRDQDQPNASKESITYNYLVNKYK